MNEQSARDKEKPNMYLAFVVYRGHVGSNRHQGVDHFNLYQNGKRNKICITEICLTLRIIHKSAKVAAFRESPSAER